MAQYLSVHQCGKLNIVSACHLYQVDMLAFYKDMTHSFMQLFHPNTNTSNLKEWLVISLFSMTNRKATARCKLLLMWYRWISTYAQNWLLMHFQAVLFNLWISDCTVQSRHCLGKLIEQQNRTLWKLMLLTKASHCSKFASICNSLQAALLTKRTQQNI